MRKATALIGIAGALAFAPAAQAAIPSVFGGAVPCTVAADGVRECGGSATTVPAFDGVPIDVNVAFPACPGQRPGRPISAGHGLPRLGRLEDRLRHLRRERRAAALDLPGLRRLQHERPRLGRQLQQDEPDLPHPRLRRAARRGPGHLRLLDTRYEVRDAQEFAGRLADESLADPQRIGATGGSYGGGCRWRWPR